VFPDSLPITISSPSSKACRKSGPFPPPELPGLNGPMDLSDARSRRHLHDVRGGEPHAIGPPPITRIALPACCAHYPGEPERVRLSASFPVLHGLPRIAGGSRRYFRGLLRLHSYYGPLACSAAQGGLCHRAPIRSLANRLSATRSSRLLSRWNLPPLATRAFGAHRNSSAYCADRRSNRRNTLRYFALRAANEHDSGHVIPS
jgi:hypothetical protein